MLEYKRDKATLETRLAELSKKAAHHDDHLRIVDAWWLQVSLSACLNSAMFTTDNDPARRRDQCVGEGCCPRFWRSRYIILLMTLHPLRRF